jgi:uncharacterized membrane protein YkgB
MKTIIAVIFFVSGTVMAQDYQAEHVVAQVVGVSPSISSVILSNEGRLLVLQKNKKVQSLQLVPSVKQEMEYAVQSLEQAELAVESREVVCMMIMPNFALQNLKVIDPESGSLKLVLSNSACSEHFYTHPKESYLLDQAQTQRSQMVILAKQLAE